MTEFLRDIPDHVSERARVVIQLAENTDAIHAADILTPWARAEPELFVQVLLAVALMADKDKQLKAAHAAYVRGERSPIIDTLEREYQRGRKRKTRTYAAGRPR